MASEPDEFDDMIAGIGEGVRKAIAEAHAAGHWTAHMDEGGIYRRHPDGRKEYTVPIEELAQPGQGEV